MMNGEQYAAMRDASGWPNGYQPQEIEGMGIGRSTDWQKLMYQNGFITNTNIGASGGNDKTQFALGGVTSNKPQFYLAKTFPDTP